MIKIGLTGGIGCGKSEVSKIFHSLGAEVYQADQRSKSLLEENSELKLQLERNFGHKLFQEGKLNRSLFASLIFSDQKQLALANSIIHPFVFSDFREWAVNMAAKKVLVMEAAILFESKADKLTDKTIVVSSPRELRIERVMKRDSVSREDVLAREKFQMPEEEKLKLADYIIYNDEKQLLIPQVLQILKSLESIN